MKKLLLLPLLLAACAPAFSNAPKPAPGEVVVQAVTTLPQPSGLSQEQEAGVVGFASIGVLLILQFNAPFTLPNTYSRFSFPGGSDSMNVLSGDDEPMHTTVDWEAKAAVGTGVIKAHWESRPLGGSFLSIRLNVASSDASINTRALEDEILQRFYRSKGITFVASGR